MLGASFHSTQQGRSKTTAFMSGSVLLINPADASVPLCLHCVVRRAHGVRIFRFSDEGSCLAGSRALYSMKNVTPGQRDALSASWYASEEEAAVD